MTDDVAKIAAAFDVPRELIEPASRWLTDCMVCGTPFDAPDHDEVCERKMGEATLHGVEFLFTDEGAEALGWRDD